MIIRLPAHTFLLVFRKDKRANITCVPRKEDKLASENQVVGEIDESHLGGSILFYVEGQSVKGDR